MLYSSNRSKVARRDTFLYKSGITAAAPQLKTVAGLGVEVVIEGGLLVVVGARRGGGAR